jgi:predicted transcriptional regulator
VDLGQMFFTQMTLESRHHAKEIHFTLPESLWYNKRKFFESFGFTSPTKAFRQYRQGEAELACSAPFSTVWTAVLDKLPQLDAKFSPAGYSLSNTILISMKPRFAERILSGSKFVEIRKKFSKKWIGCNAVLYASRPTSGVVGEARISSVTIGSPQEIWDKFESYIGCSREEFNAYVSDADQISAIELAEVVPYLAPVVLSQLSHLLNEDLRPPQSFCDLRLSNDGAWTKALRIASLLHGRFSYVR